MKRAFGNSTSCRNDFISSLSFSVLSTSSIVSHPPQSTPHKDFKGLGAGGRVLVFFRLSFWDTNIFTVRNFNVRKKRAGDVAETRMQKSRKAAGSNREGGKNASSGQVRRQLEWHQARQQQSRHLGEDGEDEYRRTTTQVPQTQRLVEILDDAQQEEPRRLVTSKQHQRRKEIAQKTAQVEDALVFKDESSDSSEDWEEVAREAPIPGVRQHYLPSSSLIPLLSDN